MRNGKFAKKGAMSKTLVLVLSLILVIGCVTGGTLAWLIDKTPDVKNTFTDSNVEITLKESEIVDADKNGVPERYEDPAEGVKNEYVMIPGYIYKKDPTVAVDPVSEDCWLFVKFEENGNPKDYLDYTSTLTTANGWTQGQGTGEGKDGIPVNVWYRSVMKNDTVREWHLLERDTITVNGDKVTKENIATAAEAKLVYYAYACQYYKTQNTPFTAAEAWEKVGF